jgi:uncharacterized protein YqgC (DUF456 family)
MHALVIALVTLVVFAIAIVAGRYGVDSPGRVRCVTARPAERPRPLSL